MFRPRLLGAAAAVAAVSIAAAGCGGSSGSSSSPPATTAAAGGANAASTTASATVSMASTGLGNILVDANGRTLYLFEKDSGGKSSCSGSCATYWPPLTVTGTPAAGQGVDASKLSTTMRSDGTDQVTYAGHPLYLYQGDSKAGDTNGQGSNGSGALWWVVSPSGSAVEQKASSGGGGGGGY